jgi:hypothetical protein
MVIRFDNLLRVIPSGVEGSPADGAVVVQT